MKIGSRAGLRNIFTGWTGEASGPITTVECLIDNNGFFEVPHLLLTYVEYLAGLFTGKGPKVTYNDVRCFLKTYFPHMYDEAGGWLIYQFRHGLVHQFAPKVLQLEDGTEIGWRVDLHRDGDGNHLRVVAGATGQQVHFCVHARRFLADFKRAAKKFREDLESNAELFKKFQSGYAAYSRPETIADLEKRYISEADKDWLRASVERAKKM